jgi:hypothetical protein
VNATRLPGAEHLAMASSVAFCAERVRYQAIEVLQVPYTPVLAVLPVCLIGRFLESPLTAQDRILEKRTKPGCRGLFEDFSRWTGRIERILLTVPLGEVTT